MLTEQDAPMIIGKLQPPDGLYEALKQIRHGKPMKHAVLLLISQELKGKVLIADNRVITGALLESSGETGQEAVDKMFLAERGMYGVREAIDKEATDLQQKLLIDIDQLMQTKSIDATAPVSQLDLDINDVDPTYLDWLQSERNKVFADLDRSMDKARETGTQHIPQVQAPTPSPAADIAKPPASTDSSSGNKWQGLDEIPTPLSVSQERRTGQMDTRPAGSPDRRGTGEQTLPPSTKISTIHTLKTSGKYKEVVDLGLTDEPSEVGKRDQTLRTEMDSMVKRRQARIALAIVGVIGFCFFLNNMFTHNEINSVFRDAATQFEKGNYKETIFLTSQALNKDPNNARLHMQKGFAHERLQQYEDALKEFDAALSTGGARLPALLGRATVFSDQKEYKKTIAECKAILVGHKDCVPAYVLMATAFDHSSQPDQAELACTDGLQYAKKPDEKARLLLERGYALARMHKNKEAEKNLSEAISLQPTPAMYMARGDVYKKLSKYPEAVADYTAVIEKDPANYNALVARGIAENYSHEEEAAIKDFAEALKINKNGLEAFIQRGSLYLSRHAYHLAVNDLEDALKLNPSIAETQQKLDSAYKQLRITVPRRVLALEQGTVSAKFKLPTGCAELLKVGYKYLNDGELEYAVTCFSQAVKNNPANEEARKYLAHALFQSGDSAGAAAQFEALNRISGVDDADILPFSQSLSRAGHTDRAITVLDSYLRTNPRATNYRCDLANLYLTANQPAKARQVINSGLAMPGLTASDRDRLLSFKQSLGGPFGNNQPGSSTDPGK